MLNIPFNIFNQDGIVQLELEFPLKPKQKIYPTLVNNSIQIQIHFEGVQTNSFLFNFYDVLSMAHLDKALDFNEDGFDEKGAISFPLHIDDKLQRVESSCEVVDIYFISTKEYDLGPASN